MSDKGFCLRVKNDYTNFNKDGLQNTISRRIRGTIFHKISITFIMKVDIFITN